MPRLLSVNVGLPRDIVWKGSAVRTAICKNPVQGRCQVSRLNLDGDGQADFGGHEGEQRAVFVYQIESYRSWAEQMKRTDFVHGLARTSPLKDCPTIPFASAIAFKSAALCSRSLNLA